MTALKSEASGVISLILLISLLEMKFTMSLSEPDSLKKLTIKEFTVMPIFPNTFSFLKFIDLKK